MDCLFLGRRRQKLHKPLVCRKKVRMASFNVNDCIEGFFIIAYSFLIVFAFKVDIPK